MPAAHLPFRAVAADLARAGGSLAPDSLPRPAQRRQGRNPDGSRRP
jgi:hypothetical protein